MRSVRTTVPVVLAAVFSSACTFLVAGELSDKPSENDPITTGDAGPTDASLESSDVLDAPIPEGAPDVPIETIPCVDCAHECCNGVCVDTRTSEEHCGACDTPCRASRECSSGQCASGWVPMSPSGESQPRLEACAVWTGTEMFVWGGRNTTDLLQTGKRYDPWLDSWADVEVQGAPSARARPVCVWAGSAVFVWGGVDQSDSPQRNGALWIPSSNTWEPIVPSNEPEARKEPIALWTGQEVLIWGGQNASGTPLVSGGLYDLSGSWRPASIDLAPPTTVGSAWTYSGSMLYMFGGRASNDVVNSRTFTYDPDADEWQEVITVGPPSARSHAFASWTMVRLVIWGGWTQGRLFIDNGRALNTANNTWEPVPSGGPQARVAVPFDTGWQATYGSESLILGGIGTGGELQNGGRLTLGPSAAWAPIDPWDPPSSHKHGVGVWTDDEFIIWGGDDGSGGVVGGSRWLP